MSFMNPTNKIFAAGVVALALPIMTAATIAAQARLTGAIFTTNSDGTFVNGNVYATKEDVYLNGGPQPNAPCTAAGLPEGDYHFQVTDPSGKVLLSEDPIQNRIVVVKDGVIVGPGPFGPHTMLPTGDCGSMTVPLMPFLGTPNPGGEYKVWMTRVVDYDRYATLGSFGFIPSKSKTDNFKVIAPDDEGNTCPVGEFEC